MAATAKSATKSEILAGVAETTGLSRKQVASVLESLAGQIKTAPGKKGPAISPCRACSRSPSFSNT